MHEKHFYVYILASKKGGVLYTGVTSDLPKRIYEHREGLAGGFSKQYFVKKLVCYEIYADAETAIHREKCIKRWKREWKIELIEKENPNWNDLYESICS